MPVAFAQSVVRKYPEWQLRVIHGVGHAPMMEAPDRWLEVVEAWLPGTRVRSAEP
jgi:pimeloyl-ACP methyl ester carboxylesterase